MSGFSPNKSLLLALPRTSHCESHVVPPPLHDDVPEKTRQIGCACGKVRLVRYERVASVQPDPSLASATYCSPTCPSSGLTAKHTDFFPQYEAAHIPSHHITSMFNFFYFVIDRAGHYRTPILDATSRGFRSRQLHLTELSHKRAGD
ncbi:hypothetical protein V2G26_017760 [Clonostachys chloroleuca]